MSASTSPPEGVQQVTLHVYTQCVDAEVFLVDSRLQLVARGVGTLVTQQVPGVYKVKVHQARDIREKTILLTKDETIYWDTPDVETSAPLFNTTRTHEYQIAGAHQRSRAVDVKKGTGSQLFLFVRNWSAKEAARVVPSAEHPAIGLTLEPWDRTWRLELSELNVQDSDRDAWCAVNIETNPGVYLLQAKIGGGAIVEQAVTAAPNWQTQVFLLSRLRRRETKSQSLRSLAEVPDLLNASILMSKGGFTADDYQFRMTEVARLALADDRPVHTTELDTLLRDKFDNPMLGILGAHLLLLARDEVRQTELDRSRRARMKVDYTQVNRPQRPFDQELFDLVVKNLRNLVGGGHADVEALSLQCASSELKATEPVTSPPMLRRSWSLLVEASNARPDLMPLELWTRTAMRASSTPFLSWLRFPDEAAARDDYISELRTQLKRSPRQTKEKVFRSMVPRPSASAADLGKMAVEFDIPRAAIDWLAKQ